MARDRGEATAHHKSRITGKAEVDFPIADHPPRVGIRASLPLLAQCRLRRTKSAPILGASRALYNRVRHTHEKSIKPYCRVHGVVSHS
jgi:hypothetical protein